MKILIRKAVPADLPAMITDPDVQLLVAELDGLIVASGYARIQPTRHFIRHPVHAYSGFFYVDPIHRGKGIIRKLIDVLKQWAASRGLAEMWLEVYYGNRPAIRAYEKVGFIPRLIEMRLPV
jgi:GNAT superfamily N-acetyltransferase